MIDAEARRAIHEDFDHTLWVEAAAGTGKTTELVRRIVELLRSGRGRLAGTVAVTFTEKAAGELKLRLRTELETARTSEQNPVIRDRIDHAIREIETARIGTIHALCAELLRERPVEAGVDPLFEVLGDEEEERVFTAAFQYWFEHALEDPPEGVRRMLRRPPDRLGHGPVFELKQAGHEVARRRDFDGAWARPTFDRDGAIDATIASIGVFAAYAGRASSSTDYLARSAEVAAEWLHELARREDTEPRDHDALEWMLDGMRKDADWKRTGRGVKYGSGVTRDEVKEARDGAKRGLDAFAVACSTDLAACLFDDLQPLIAQYGEAKRASGRLDYIDLLLLAKQMLVGNARLREELQARFTHVFVDEFQDTDPLQADILLLLAADDPTCSDPARARPAAGKLFVVGDPKQAIYRFRRADVMCYAALRDRLVGAGARLLHLSTSFRSDPRIQEAVNAAFAPRMQGGRQASYVPLDAFRVAAKDQPAVVALPVPRPYAASGRVTVDAIEESLPTAIAAFVDWLLCESGWVVSEAGHDDAVPVEARHVCLLFRTTRRLRTDVVAVYARALEGRGIPHAVVGGRAFHDRDEVLAIRNALVAVEWPEDLLSVYATLKGPLFGLPDDALYLWRARFGTLDPLRRHDPSPEDPARADLLEVRDGLEILAEVRTGRNHRPIASTIHRLLAATRAHAGFAAAANGDQLLANVLRVGQLARRFEATGSTSFRSFVEALDEQADHGESPDAPVVEEGTDGVRLMTVHKAKGLEFPVVILADITSPFARTNPSRYIDAAKRVWAVPLCGCVPHELQAHAGEILEDDRHESDRIAYVAATRARDVLVVPVVGDDRRSGWVEPLHPALYPAQGTRTRPGPAPGCPPFRGSSVVEGHPSVEPPVVPGLHRPSMGTHEVVWWEALDAEQRVAEGLRQVSLFAPDEDGGASANRYERWRTAHAESLAAGARPTIDARLATELPARGFARRIVVEATDRPLVPRPEGARFGSLVHAILATVPFDAPSNVIDAHVAMHGRILGATRDERAAAGVAVEAALRHPLLMSATMSPDCRREVPIAWRDDQTLVEGVVDLAFLHEGGWTVVDYKTDGLAPHVRRYEAQLAAYVAAVGVSTGIAVRGVILAV